MNHEHLKNMSSITKLRHEERILHLSRYSSSRGCRIYSIDNPKSPAKSAVDLGLSVVIAEAVKSCLQQVQAVLDTLQ